MSNGSYRFPLGNFECICLNDGSLDYPLKDLFANVALSEVESALRKYNLPIDYITTPYTYLYVDTHQHRLLVDMGAGNLGPRTGKLFENMQAAGISPAEIDTVIITHAHPDHVGGMLDEAGNLNLPNATYFISKVEWDFWFSQEASQIAPEVFVGIARRNLEPIRGRVRLIEHEMELVPGIYAIPAYGHTPGHTIVKVSSEEALLYYMGDTVLHPLHLEHPDWLPVFDLLPDQAIASKEAVIKLVTEQPALVIGQHFSPFPGLGQVVKQGEGWRWRPIGS